MTESRRRGVLAALTRLDAAQAELERWAGRRFGTTARYAARTFSRRTLLGLLLPGSTAFLRTWD
jgi:hypothetical protein